MNAQDAVVQAVLTRLRQAPAIAGAILEDAEVDPLPETVDEAVVVSFLGSTPSAPLLGSPVDWSTRLRIECYVRADSRTPAGRASRELHRRVYVRLQVDPSLGGLASDMSEPTIASDTDRSSTELGCVVAEYEITHRTAARTLEPA